MCRMRAGRARRMARVSKAVEVEKAAMGDVVAMRIAIYARAVITDQDAELQLRELRDYAGRRGFVVHREYVDRPSGHVRGRGRPSALDALMADARRHRFDCVLGWKLNHFALSLGTLVATLREFGEIGVGFISHTEAIDTTGPMGRMFHHVIGSFAEFEHDIFVEHVRAGLAKARADGTRLGRPVRDSTAQARVVALKNEGLSLRQIAHREHLSPEGVRKVLRRAHVGASPTSDPA